MSLTATETRRAALALGVREQPGLSVAYPDLVTAMQRLFQDRVAGIPWVPRSWFSAVAEVQAKNMDSLILLAPGLDASGNRGLDCPSFADTDAKAKAWQDVFTAAQSAVVAYAKGQQEDGAAELAALTANAAFWDAAYNVADFAKNLPSTIVAGFSTVGTNALQAFLPDALKGYAKWIFWGLLFMVITGIVLWYRKSLSALLKGVNLGKGSK